MTSYEMLIENFKEKVGLKEFKKRETFYIVQSSMGGCFIAACFTNVLEVIVVRRQSAQSSFSIIEMIKNERFNLLTKGLAAKVL